MSKYVSDRCLVSSVRGIPVNTGIPASTQTYDQLGGREVAYVVMHYTGNDKDTARANAKYFSGGDRDASAHYFVDETSVYQSVPACDRAWAVGSDNPVHPYCRNTNSISIEMCCSGDYKVSAATKANAAALCATLCKYLGITDVDTYVLRHWDVTGKSCPRQMAGNGNVEWDAFKASVKALLGAGTPAKAPAASNNKEETIHMDLRMLKRGMEGGDVRAAMLLMKDKGYYPDEIWSGDKLFGPKMEAGLRKMQADHNLGVDGILGAASWGYLLGR